MCLFVCVLIFVYVYYLCVSLNIFLISPGQLSDELRELGRLGIESSVCKKVFGSYITDHHFCTTGTDVKHICLVSQV